jgi:acetyltransferase
MSTYRLDKLFSPRSVAVVGASPRETSPGHAVLRNLRAAGFQGPIGLVNPHYREIAGVTAVKTYADLSAVPDLIVIAAPPPAVPSIVAAAGEAGTGAAIIITSGLGHGAASFAQTCEETARANGLRLLGPNCLGLLAPAANLNASFAGSMALSGDLALISQSGAIATGLVDWAAQRAVGFSAVVSLGDQIDVDFGDLLDFFTLDRRTRAILLYVEAVKEPRKFLSAARAAARIKPVLVIKSGRFAQGAQVAQTHTGALAGVDAVYDTAFRRAGLLRVYDLEELFAAVETLARLRPFDGKRLAILTNGGGIGVLAVDELTQARGTLAQLSGETIERLGVVLPPIWSGANPVDIAGDANGARYGAAMKELLADSASDAILVMNVPTALASPTDAAHAVIAAVEAHEKEHATHKPVLAVWLGGQTAASELFEAADIPSYATEADAVRGFMHMVRYRETIDQLMATPPNISESFTPDLASAREILRSAIAAGRKWLDPIEITSLLGAYGIPIVPALLARNPDEAALVAAPLLANGSTVAAKILSPDIVHKSEVGGVRLNLTSEGAVRAAVADILARARAAKPDARIVGVTIHPMIVRPKARELIIGVTDDPVFGPVVVFGHGGTAVEVVDDKALALPPLDLNMAHDLIARTRIARLLKAYRDVPAVDQNAVALMIVKVAQLAVDLPEIRELDLNPILADSSEVIAVDARVAVATEQSTSGKGNPRLVVRPYPKEWERHITLRDGTGVFIRPLRPEDEPLYPPFLACVSPDDLRLRFFAPIKEFTHTFIARFTQLDYARAMAFIALDESSGRMLGVVRLHANSNYDSGEYAVLVQSDLKGRGLGWALMQLIIAYARAEGLSSIAGEVLRDNTTMLAMCRELGFEITANPEDLEICQVKLEISY